MKQKWTRLSQMVIKLGGNTRFMEPRFENLFMRHHKNACEIIMDRVGNPMAAVYFTPAGSNKVYMEAFMKALRDRVLK